MLHQRFTKAAKTGWLSLLCFVGCARPILPYRRIGVLNEPRRTAEAVAASRAGSIPADARRIAMPEWAKLASVWGSYDPPLVNEIDALADIAFARDENSLLLLGSQGEIYLWDRVKRETVAKYVNCVLPQDPPRPGARSVHARSLVLGQQGRMAVGFSSGDYCILESLTGKRLSVVKEPSQQEHWFLMVAHLSSKRLLTYGYEPEMFYPSKLGGFGSSAAGGYLRAWDIYTGKLVSEANVGRAFAAAFSRDGSHLALQNNGLCLLDQYGQRAWAKPYAANQIEFVSNQKLLLLETNRLLTVATKDGALIDEWVGEPIRSTAPGDLELQHIRMAEDGRSVLVQRNYGRLGVWSLPGLEPIADRQYLGNYWVSSAAPAKHGTLFLTGNTSILDVTRFEIGDPPGGRIDCLAASADAKRVVACRTKNLELWDETTHSVRRLAREDNVWVEASRDASVFLIGRSEENGIVEWEHGNHLQRLPHHLWAPAAIGDDAQSFALEVWQGSPRRCLVEMRDVRAGQVRWRNANYEGSGWQSSLTGSQLKFSDDGNRVLVVTQDRRVIQLAAKDGSFISALAPMGKGEWRLLGDLGLWCDESGIGVTAYDLVANRVLWEKNERNSTFNLAKRLDTETWLHVDGDRIRRRSVETGDDTVEPIDMSPSFDAPTYLAATRDAGIFVIGTRRGVVLRISVLSRISPHRQ